MRTLQRILATMLFLLLTLASLAGPVGSAQAVTGYTLTAGGARTTASGKAIKLTVSFRNNGKAVKKATVMLQYQRGEEWITEKKVKVKSGKGAVKVKHVATDRTYRFSANGKATSAPFTVHFLPATFSFIGSGSGHGVGLSQYGAYGQAREGRTAREILDYYYPGSTTGVAFNNSRTVKVQVLGPPADSRRTTKLSINTGGFTITDGTSTLATTAARKPVTVRVSGSKVTAKVRLANGKSRTLAASRLVFTWDTSRATVSVAGAHGSYRYGNLQATVIRARPNLVNEVAMNTEYLYGIDEMPSSWGSPAGGGLEALKAQVIAARSYVILQALKWKTSAGEVNPACDCQVFDDPRSQNFTGAKKAWGAGNAYWRQAVDETMTAGTVQVVRPSATSLGEIAETPYFAASGQVALGGSAQSGTAGNADVFGTTPISYLTHVPDPYSSRAPGNPYRSWTRKLSQAQLAGILGVGKLRSVRVAEYYEGGLVKSLEVTTATGVTRSITRSAEAWRTSLGLPGAWVTSITVR